MKPQEIIARLEAVEGKLNTFATLIHDQQPQFRDTLEAVYNDMKALKDTLAVLDQLTAPDVVALTAPTVADEKEF